MKLKEADEQAVVIEYCAFKNLPIFAIPNGGSRHKLEAINLKRQGVKAGVPDLFLPIASSGKHGLFLEMKVKPNKPTKMQLEWQERLNSIGYLAVVCYGADEAIKVIDDYLGGRA